MLISGSNLSKSFSGEDLFWNVSFNIDSNDKIGFVGVNGAGKSTLIKILIGDLEVDSGDVFRSKQLKIGYLDQYSCAESNKTIFDEVLTVYERLINAENELSDIHLQIETGSGDIDSLIVRQTYLNDLLAENDGLYFRNKVKSTLIGLGFSEEELSKSVAKLSGGQKTRVELAKILLSDSNLLLLDEPTNHLDITSVEWLEDFLKSYNGAFVVISHDRYFLDKVTNKTFEMTGGTLFSFNGNYSAYNSQKAIDSLTKEHEYENKMREIKRLEEVIEQQRRWNREKNIKTAESKQKVVDRIKDTLVEPDKKDEEIEFGFHAYIGGGNDVLSVSELSKAFGDKEIFKSISFEIKKGEKVFLLGPNGCGKTTLIKIILDECKQNGGTVKIGTDIHIGYYDQIQDNLSPNKTVIDEIWDEYPLLTQTEIRNALAGFLFKGEDVFKPIGALSGGERARVLLVKLILKKVNFLIMDEPTNHLDINSRIALENALEGYGGTMLMVSHDRYFINKLSDRIIYMLPNKVISYPGGYDDFCEKYSAEIAGESTSQKQKEKSSALSYKEQKQREAEKRKTINRIKKLEDLIAELEDKIDELNKELVSPKVSTDYVLATEISEKITENENALADYMTEWEELSAMAENF